MTPGRNHLYRKDMTLTKWGKWLYNMKTSSEHWKKSSLDSPQSNLYIAHSVWTQFSSCGSQPSEAHIAWGSSITQNIFSVCGNLNVQWLILNHSRRATGKKDPPDFLCIPFFSCIKKYQKIKSQNPSHQTSHSQKKNKTLKLLLQMAPPFPEKWHLTLAILQQS